MIVCVMEFTVGVICGFVYVVLVNGDPAIAVSAPVVASMVKPETVPRAGSETYRNLPVESIATPVAFRHTAELDGPVGGVYVQLVVTAVPTE